MALRIRKNGDILCAAHTEPQEGDTYIDDSIHYYMSVMTGSIVASPNHDQDNLWFWNVEPDVFEHHKEINPGEIVYVRKSLNHYNDEKD